MSSFNAFHWNLQNSAQFSPFGSIILRDIIRYFNTLQDQQQQQQTNTNIQIQIGTLNTTDVSLGTGASISVEDFPHVFKGFSKPGGGNCGKQTSNEQDYLPSTKYHYVQPESSKRRPPVCHFCLQAGHFAMKCPEKAAGKRRIRTSRNASKSKSTSVKPSSAEVFLSVEGNTQSTKPRKQLVCRHCKEVGHCAIFCEKRASGEPRVKVRAQVSAINLEQRVDTCIKSAQSKAQEMLNNELHSRITTSTSLVNDTKSKADHTQDASQLSQTRNPFIYPPPSPWLISGRQTFENKHVH